LNDCCHNKLVSLLPGIEAAGIVEKVDENVKDISVATRVYSSGIFSLSAYAEERVCEVGEVHPSFDHFASW
jgi:NADPH:quinone reductase-like Zn-dependent oxidoreductase